MFLYYRGVNPNVAVNGNVKFVDISERRSKRVSRKTFCCIYVQVISKDQLRYLADEKEFSVIIEAARR